MAASGMPEDRFWEIIERKLGPDIDPDTRIEVLRASLRALPIEEVIAFEVTFRRLLNEAYSWDLWGAAYVIHGGASDDAFEYFRRWLASRGRDAYRAALTDPDSLADLPLEPAGPFGIWEFEEFYYVAVEVFEEKGGEGDVRDHSETEAGLGMDGPSGEPFEDDEDHLRRRYPKLWERFGEAPLG